MLAATVVLRTSTTLATTAPRASKHRFCFKFNPIPDIKGLSNKDPFLSCYIVYFSPSPLNNIVIVTNNVNSTLTTIITTRKNGDSCWEVEDSSLDHDHDDGHTIFQVLTWSWWWCWYYDQFTYQVKRCEHILWSCLPHGVRYNYSFHDASSNGHLNIKDGLYFVLCTLHNLTHIVHSIVVKF